MKLTEVILILNPKTSKSVLFNIQLKVTRTVKTKKIFFKKNHTYYL